MSSSKTFIALWILWVGSAAWAQAEDATAAPQDTGWYMVRPGDTLRSLTARYLGSEERWRENWQLNADQIANPDLIRPGQEIRLVLPPKLPADGALLRQVSNRVEDQPTPMSWNDSQDRELLRSRDGVKTHENSSAELEFSDDTRLLLTEQSTVFIGEESKAPAQVDRQQIEIVVGQADLKAPRAAEASDRYEIVLGDAKATPKRDPAGSLETRARLAEKGAQLMVYHGESALTAAGAEVTVATGMGSSVPRGEPPAPPEKLLPAARDLEPAAGARLATPRPTFRWQPVAGARHYVVEICRDERCAVLLERVAEVAEASWQPAGLPVASLFWRVTAVSPSGLDGYPATAVPFEITSTAPDNVPPTVRIGFVGPQVAPRSGLHEVWIVGPGVEIEVEVVDDESGVERWTPRIDGEEIAPERLKGPFSKGAHTLSVAADDRAGNHRETMVPFIFDPDPPEVSWGVEGGSALGDTMGEPGEDVSGPGPALRGRNQLRVSKLDWEILSDLAQIRVRPQTRKPIGLEGLGSLSPQQGLWVLATDEHCPDLTDLAYDLIAGSRRGEVVLRFEAVDCVGNTRRGQVSLVRQSKK